MGYGDFGSYGAPDVKTPHIDSLAKDGVRLTDFYANGATCTPTRTGLMSGRYQQRFALERPIGSATSADAEMGLPATGRRFAYKQMHLIRVVGGMGVEHWAVRDDADLMRQLTGPVEPAPRS